MAQPRGVTSAITLALSTLVVTIAVSACGSSSHHADVKPAGKTQGVSSAASSSTAPAKTTPAKTTSAKSIPAKSTPAKSTPAKTSPVKTTSAKSTPAKSTPAKSTPAKPPARDTLRAGMTGADVRALQKRLDDLGYWMGTPDGDYGDQTSQAVMALQKAAGVGADGVAGPQTEQVLARGVRPEVRTTSGSAIEVDKAKQLVKVVLDGKLKYIFNTSTGSGAPYTQDGATYIASTPEGRFTVERQIDGMRISKLGQLWRPKYFYEGYALHGAESIPAYPASHGCARLSDAAIDFVWSADLAPIGRTVWVY